VVAATLALLRLREDPSTPDSVVQSLPPVIATAAAAAAALPPLPDAVPLRAKH